MHPATDQPSSLRIILNTIRTIRNQDSVIFGGYFLPERTLGVSEPQVLESKMNDLSFSFSAAEFKTPYLLQYRTRMEGLEDDWSPWTMDTRRDFTSLGPGNYIFHAQARIKDGVESDVVSYVFRIRPPWFKTTTAKLVYGMGVLGFLRDS
jgi:hypothetical protein